MRDINELFDNEKNLEKSKISSKDIFTTVIRIKGGKTKVCPIKTSIPVEISMFKEISKALGRVYISVPVKSGDVVCKNILNSGSDIVITKTVDK